MGRNFEDYYSELEAQNQKKYRRAVGSVRRYNRCIDVILETVPAMIAEAERQPPTEYIWVIIKGKSEHKVSWEILSWKMDTLGRYYGDRAIYGYSINLLPNGRMLLILDGNVLGEINFSHTSDKDGLWKSCDFYETSDDEYVLSWNIVSNLCDSITKKALDFGVPSDKILKWKLPNGYSKPLLSVRMRR